MKKILILASILFSMSCLYANTATRCETVPKTEGYWWDVKVVPGTVTNCYTYEVTPEVKEYSQNRCNREFPWTEYRSGGDGCYCAIWEYDHTSRKCIDKNVMCNEKYPWTKYQADWDKCVCSNWGQYDSNRKSCEDSEYVEPEYVEPERVTCTYWKTKFSIGEESLENLICQYDWTWRCATWYIWGNNACSLPETFSWSDDWISYSVIKTPFDAATYLSWLWIITERNTPSEYMVQSLVLRQELIWIALKLKKITLSENYTCQNIFSDISQSKPNEWVCRAAETALINGIITKNKFFNPRSNVTISEALAMVFSALELPEKPYDWKTNYFYPNIEQWQKSVLISSRNYWMIDSTNIDPNLPVNRWAVFLMITKAFGK